MTLSETEKELVKQKVRNRRREMLGIDLSRPSSSDIGQPTQENQATHDSLSNFSREGKITPDEFAEPKEDNITPRINTTNESVSVDWKYALCTLIVILALIGLGVFIGYMLAGD